MCCIFRELQELNGDPIDFEWNIFSENKVLNILHEIQEEL